ncbi:hypothetical protein [Actinokineospora sp. NBRC 105648]|uniref:hypothetical protein n=1 Tax=Actinokineospora sp. NBRC 105648 TaxID=3032206 RepID=UPI0025578892|nr:hypothetical protein [Actinokineospora sp. NBRC 105648]
MSLPIFFVYQQEYVMGESIMDTSRIEDMRARVRHLRERVEAIQVRLARVVEQIAHLDPDITRDR